MAVPRQQVHGGLSSGLKWPVGMMVAGTSLLASTLLRVCPQRRTRANALWREICLTRCGVQFRHPYPRHIHVAQQHRSASTRADAVAHASRPELSTAIGKFGLRCRAEGHRTWAPVGIARIYRKSRILNEAYRMAKGQSTYMEMRSMIGIGAAPSKPAPRLVNWRFLYEAAVGDPCR
ncbi:hypothetical protein IE81DRAFT_190903 [Ceraceosorus guamensis]|uniref:Uncharacterized protein n=1 Tax=Ceraceosorus guamensis TaxID=1522189 RepID=A0A316WC00_9BASI|nr:hypothetical protein IE81DRAFT_190903 [Ceraceosorus guamensis]PWN45433.1 hypothetical protein IE81DRAFT_190903 [Ceraceosorus guamensis]